MWESIGNISSPISLTAFLCAVVASYLMYMTRKKMQVLGDIKDDTIKEKYFTSRTRAELDKLTSIQVFELAKRRKNTQRLIYFSLIVTFLSISILFFLLALGRDDLMKTDPIVNNDPIPVVNIDPAISDIDTKHIVNPRKLEIDSLKQRLAILPFNFRGDNHSKHYLADLVTDIFLNEFGNFERFILIEREMIDEITKELDYGRNEYFDKTKVCEIGKLLGVEIMVFGGCTL